MRYNFFLGTTETDIINGIKTVQMWFNDQPDIHSSGNKQLEGYHHSHGKVSCVTRLIIKKKVA